MCNFSTFLYSSKQNRKKINDNSNRLFIVTLSCLLSWANFPLNHFCKSNKFPYIFENISSATVLGFRAGGKTPSVRPPGQIRASKSDWGPLLEHINTPELNPPRTDFTYFTFNKQNRREFLVLHRQISLSAFICIYYNMSKKFILLSKPIFISSKPITAKYIVGNFVVTTVGSLVSW